ncbi:RNA polymerase sigma factor [Marinifilum sp.]|uniref:RNA polymerase sigma factor n=1 Tax=Marinifilum sp. TaxID=2033137 RepID=UPI003BA910AB
MKNSDSIDSKLWIKITNDDEKAFGTVFDKYFSPLCKYSFQIVKELEPAEEVVSDVFVKLWLNRHTIKIETDLKSYLFRACKNTALNYLRKTKNNISLDEIIGKELMSVINTDSDLIHKEVCTQIQQMLDMLTPQQSLVLKLHKLEGLSQQEIAQKLSISIKTVQNHIYLGLLHLTKQLASRKHEFYLFVILMLSA